MMKLFNTMNKLHILIALISLISAVEEVTTITTATLVTMAKITVFQIVATVTRTNSEGSPMGTVNQWVGSKEEGLTTFKETSWLLTTALVNQTVSSNFLTSVTTTVILTSTTFTTSTRLSYNSISSTARTTSSAASNTPSSIIVTAQKTSFQQTAIVVSVLVPVAAIIFAIFIYFILQRRKKHGLNKSLRGSFGWVHKWDAGGVPPTPPTGIVLGSTPSHKNHKIDQVKPSFRSSQVQTTEFAATSPARPSRPKSLTWSERGHIDHAYHISEPLDPRVSVYDPNLNKVAADACQKKEPFSSIVYPVLTSSQPELPGSADAGLPGRTMSHEPLLLCQKSNPGISPSNSATKTTDGLIGPRPYATHAFGSINRANSKAAHRVGAPNDRSVHNLRSEFNSGDQKAANISPAELDSIVINYKFHDFDEQDGAKRAEHRATTLMTLEGDGIRAKRSSSVYSREVDIFHTVSEKKRKERERREQISADAARKVREGGDGFF